MNRRFLTAVLISACCFLFVSKSDACELPPIAEISNPYTQTVCVGCPAEFDGSTSYDQDEEGISIEVYYWNYSEDSDWHEDGAEPNHTFNTADLYWVYLYVRDDEGVLSSYDTCYVAVVRVDSVDEDKTSACVNETVTFTAIPYPPLEPLSCVEWMKYYRLYSTDLWGLGTSAGTGSTATLIPDKPGYYMYQARNGSDDSWKSSSEITVVGAEITSAPEYVLVYTGSHSGEQPTRLAIARGDPKGGTFSWSYEKSGTGDIEFVGFTDGPPAPPYSSQYAEIKGTVQSSVWGDVELKVKYTLSGVECEATSVSLTVRRMKYTSSYAGVLTPLGEGPARYRRYYYHPIFDQFEDYIDEAGIPCDETVEWVKGKKGWTKTGPGSTSYYPHDGEYLGWAAVQDRLECHATHTWAEYHQHLKAGGWDTSPNYYIYLDPIGDSRRIWKEQTTD